MTKNKTWVNYSGLLRWFLIAFLLSVLVYFITPPVDALIPRLEQGDLVAVGSVVDISGVVGWTTTGDYYLAYYGRSGYEMDPQYIITISGSKKLLYNFYIDPAIFDQRLGQWFQFYGNTTNLEHGNLLAFRVVKELPAVNVTNTTPTPLPTPTPEPFIVLPKNFDTDYQIAYGDPFSVTVNEKYMPARLWVFGRLDAFYNRSYPTSKIVITPGDIQTLEAGTYTVIVQNPGKNAIFEVGYTKTITDITTTEELTSPWAAVKPVDIYGIQPRMVLVEFHKLLSTTDDVLTEYRIEIANPVIDIISIDEVYSGGKDVLDIRGYTNVAVGTEITFVMDKDKQTDRTLRANTFVEVVREQTPNQWRYFQVIIPINYDEMPVGQHQITATVPQGASQTVPYYVYDLPAGQVTPNETVKYIAGDLFRPTPTPEIVTVVQTVIQTQIVTVPVTPSNEQVYDQQKRASDTNFWFWISNGTIIVTLGSIMYFGGWYVFNVIKRARLK